MAMFSLLITFFPALVALGALAIFVLAIPFGVGIFLQLVLSIIAQRRRVLLIPAGLGVLGLICCLFLLRPDMESLPYLLLYWAVYFLTLWLTWLVVDQCKKFIARHRVKG